MDTRNAYRTLIDLGKIILPLAGILALSLMFLLVEPPAGRGDLGGAPVLKESQEASRARVTSVTDAGDEYEIISRLVTPGDQGLAMIDPDAKIIATTGDVTRIRAREGFMPTGRQIADLSRNVRVHTNFGYRLTTESLQIDLDSSRISSPVKVHGVTPFGVITAGSMILDGDGQTSFERADFQGGVHLIYDPTTRGRDSR